MNIKFLFGATLVITILSSSVAFAASPSFGAGGSSGVTSTISEKVDPYPRFISVWNQRYAPNSGCSGIVYLLEDGVLMIEEVDIGPTNCDYSWKSVGDSENYFLLGKIDAFTTIHVRNDVQLSCNGSADTPQGCSLDNLKEKHEEFLANRERTINFISGSSFIVMSGRKIARLK